MVAEIASRFPRPGRSGSCFHQGGSYELGLACQQIAQAITVCFMACRKDPRQRTARHHPPHGDLATRVLQGRTMERWQYEITAGGRVWFLIDEDKHTIWTDEVHLGHPAKTGK